MAKDEDVSVGVSTRGGAHVPHAKYERLIARAKELPPVPTIVAHPCDETSLRGATEAAEAGIIVPILVGPVGKIAAVAQAHGLDISRFEIVDGPSDIGAVAQAHGLDISRFEIVDGARSEAAADTLQFVGGGAWAQRGRAALSFFAEGRLGDLRDPGERRQNARRFDRQHQHFLVGRLRKLTEGLQVFLGDEACRSSPYSEYGTGSSRVFSPQRPNQRDQFVPGRLAFRFANHSILESKTGSVVERNLSLIHIPVA